MSSQDDKELIKRCISSDEAAWSALYRRVYKTVHYIAHWHKWNFSPDMVDIIRNHHTPEKGAKDDLALPVIYLADSICMMIGVGGGVDGLSYRYHQEVMDRLNFSDVDLQKTIAEFWEQLRDVEGLIQLSQGDM